MKWFIKTALSVTCFVLLQACEAPASPTTYPKNFVWGVAFSAHQAEGMEGGGEYGDWWSFEHRNPSPIGHGDTADRAVDHWNRYAEDLELSKSLGVDSVRISIAWEKVEPVEGQFNQAVLDHYRDVLVKMKELGLRPMVALHHYTHPRWFHEGGGWLSDSGPAKFTRYSEAVVDRLGDLCDLWITFNEPMILVILGYERGEFPPNVTGSQNAFRAAYEMARAHRMVASMIHKKQGRSRHARGSDGALRGVGVVNSFGVFDPADPKDPNDVGASELMYEWRNWGIIRGIVTGKLELKYPNSRPAAEFKAELPSDEADKSPIDWLGVNYYSRNIVKYKSSGSDPIAFVPILGPVADNWWPIYPEGMERILRLSAEKFPALPLVVSENGLADANDSARPSFIRDHLKFMDKVVHGLEGAPRLDVRGYYHWSLFDNFEWLRGYQDRFGLFEIRYDEGLKRVPRPSAAIFTEEILKRR
jgi:beta-glucosidase